ncbi:hypothetical protein GOV08_05045 [Candidatus Woesearchaeota archaeon]|nr:hypothetical protein [Candidatus Woesearchaeota archaeon]
MSIGKLVKGLMILGGAALISTTVTYAMFPEHIKYSMGLMTPEQAQSFRESELERNTPKELTPEEKVLSELEGLNKTQYTKVLIEKGIEQFGYVSGPRGSSNPYIRFR